ncbi:hypothetical protein AAB109_11350 [Priestia megaterium]|uniref:hypothetical protein n=1 Tax=Priestia megaterium TaxID=1404 RepID=UPI002ACE4E0D|nr:hypothetical protein [Priestia megaterium]
MNLNENIKTNITNSSVDSESSIYKKSVDSESSTYKKKDINAFIKKEGNLYSVKENSSNSNNDTVYSKESTASSLQDTRNENRTKKKRYELEKRKVLNMLINENIAVGYTSMTEMYFKQLLKVEGTSLTKEVINLIYAEHFDNPEILQKITEVMSNLDYDELYPTNTILALGMTNHTDINVQEAAIAAYEKWDDKRNLKFLKNINYTADWIEDYANSVIDYLESC